MTEKCPFDFYNKDLFEILQEVVSPMKETLDKSVIHTMPLVQNDIPNIQRRSVNTSIVNFKKFRKVNIFSSNYKFFFFFLQVFKR